MRHDIPMLQGSALIDPETPVEIKTDAIVEEEL
jgi:hypothetical protein